MEGEVERDAYEFILDDPRIVGAIWFDMNEETDWHVDSSRESANAYREILSHRWLVTVFTDLERGRTDPEPPAGSLADRRRATHALVHAPLLLTV